jgi:anaerobic magnesium-protoporphyrin IX monomethyl ester cyclase
MEVLFVHPNASKKIYQSLSKNLSAIEPPIWAALLANNLRSIGYHDIAILDCEAEGLTPSMSAERIEQYNAKLVVFVVYGQQPSASTQNMQGVHDCLEILKQNKPNQKVLLTGLYPSAVSRKTMMEEKTDFVCQGEGPGTIRALLQISDLTDTTQLRKVPGLWYREDGRILFTKPAPLIAQDEMAHELPGMAWDLLPMDKYRTSNWHAMSNNNITTPFASLYTSLGCPFRCSFCCINAPFGNNNVENWDYGRNKFRFWNPDFMITEFDKINKMGIKNIKIADEMFVLKQDHFMNLCNKIIDRGYDFNIWAYARIDTVKKKYLDTLKKAGVEWLALGIESGNKVVRKDVVKGRFTEVNIKDLVKEVQDAGINVIGNYIFGLPEDNIETMQETLDLAKELNCEFANFYCSMAYPGSKLYLDALKNNQILPDSYVGYSQHSYDMRPLDTKYISAAEVVKFRDYAFHDYHEDKKYLKMVEKKFGKGTRQKMVDMCKHKLKRRLLGD